MLIQPGVNGGTTWRHVAATGRTSSHRSAGSDAEQYSNAGRWLDVAVSGSVPQAWIGLYFDAATFFYISTLMNWTDAQSYCRLHYTDLASIRSLQENEQIRTMRPAGLTVWIGLYKDTWKWSNGNLFLFSYWASGQPQGGVENCTVADFSLSGHWEDWPCGLEKASVCYHGETPSVDQRTKEDDKQK
uniref:C-type lectin domain-containing protein n=1 Tax=Poecilia latipinna TaxID=48699 RepID=A0A3B3TPI1_9TELE